MELSIPQFIIDEPQAYSASAAEVGQDAGAYTWSNALDDVDQMPLTTDQVESLMDYFDSFGAWDDIHEWSDEDITALTIQEIVRHYRKYLAGADDGLVYPVGSDLFVYLGV